MNSCSSDTFSSNSPTLSTIAYFSDKSRSFSALFTLIMCAFVASMATFCASMICRSTLAVKVYMAPGGVAATTAKRL